ncbi:Hypothetical protein ORPV_662, partial [Orpheovirus IHUMI-LCC2]
VEDERFGRKMESVNSQYNITLLNPEGKKIRELIRLEGDRLDGNELYNKLSGVVDNSYPNHKLLDYKLKVNDMLYEVTLRKPNGREVKQTIKVEGEFDDDQLYPEILEIVEDEYPEYELVDYNLSPGNIILYDVETDDEDDSDSDSDGTDESDDEEVEIDYSDEDE